MTRNEVLETNNINFTREGLKKLAGEIRIPLKEISREINIDERIALYFSTEELSDQNQDLFMIKIPSHNSSSEDISFFHDSAPAISQALDNRKKASNSNELKTASEELDKILIEKSEKAKTVYHLMTLYYTAPNGSTAKKPILEKMYKLINL